MKYKIGIVSVLVLGALIGFFGVLLSVFGDASAAERNQFIVLILLVYFVLGGIIGYLLPAYDWKWGLIFGAPGALVLIPFLLESLHPLMLGYFILVLAIPSVGALFGSRLAGRRASR